MKRKTIAHYEILRRLGAGGNGVVYAANDTLLQRPVVLKMLHTGALTAEQMRSTVLREARLASAIEHPNVCAIYEVGESGDEAYIAMQYVPGQSLDTLIERGPGKPSACSFGGNSDCGWTAGGACAGHLSPRPEAAECHADRRRPYQDSGLWTGEAVAAGRCALRSRKAGFGERSTAPGYPYCARRNLRYMAPEQFVTGHSSMQSDIWALGVILFELASGRHPFRAPEAEDFQAVRAIQFLEPDDLGAIVPEFPRN